MNLGRAGKFFDGFYSPTFRSPDDMTYFDMVSVLRLANSKYDLVLTWWVRTPPECKDFRVNMKIFLLLTDFILAMFV
jgi:hypothetical protein